MPRNGRADIPIAKPITQFLARLLAAGNEIAVRKNRKLVVDLPSVHWGLGWFVGLDRLWRKRWGPKIRRPPAAEIRPLGWIAGRCKRCCGAPYASAVGGHDLPLASGGYSGRLSRLAPPAPALPERAEAACASAVLHLRPNSESAKKLVSRNMRSWIIAAEDWL